MFEEWMRERDEGGHVMIKSSLWNNLVKKQKEEEDEKMRMIIVHKTNVYSVICLKVMEEGSESDRKENGVKQFCIKSSPLFFNEWWMGESENWLGR